MRRFVGCVMAVMALATPAGALLPANRSAAVAATTRLVIHGRRGPRRFTIETAVTPEEQERGLMYRRAMARDHGMIFPMDPPRPASFWMKNTYIPLDIIFIGPDHRIVSIAARAKPLSTDTIDCADPVTAVLELNGGVAAHLGIKVGDRVDW